MSYRLGFEFAAELKGRGIAVRPVGRLALDRLRRRGFDEGQDFGRDEWKIAIQALAEARAWTAFCAAGCV